MFPQRLKQCRKQKGLSLKKLAAEFGMSHSTLSKYETGTRRPDPDTLIMLATYFNVSTDYLLGLSPTPYGSLLAVNAEALPPDAKRELDSFVGYLTEKYCKGGQ